MAPLSLSSSVPCIRPVSAVYNNSERHRSLSGLRNSSHCSTAYERLDREPFIKACLQRDLATLTAIDDRVAKQQEENGFRLKSRSVSFYLSKQNIHLFMRLIKGLLTCFLLLHPRMICFKRPWYSLPWIWFWFCTVLFLLSILSIFVFIPLLQRYDFFKTSH